MGALVLAVVVAVVIGCNKEKAKVYAETETISKEDDMSAYLKQFKEKMQSPTKGGETLTMEDARWHLEAVLNYTFGDVGYQISDIQCDTFHYKLHTEGEGVSLTHLNEAFNSLSVDVEKSFTACDLPDKSVLAIQTKFEDDCKSGDISVQTILTIRGFAGIKMWFDSTDYWSDSYYYYKDEQGNIISAGGKCGPYAGQCMNSGAPKELEKLSNLRIPLTACDENRYRTYITDVEDVWLNSIENDNYMMDANSPCGYKIYINSDIPWDPSHNPSHCIPPDDMNYYLSKFTEIMIHYTPNGKYPIRATYIRDVYLGHECEIDLFWLSIQYGVIQCVPKGPEDY